MDSRALLLAVVVGLMVAPAQRKGSTIKTGLEKSEIDRLGPFEEFRMEDAVRVMVARKPGPEKVPYYGRISGVDPGDPSMGLAPRFLVDRKLGENSYEIKYKLWFTPNELRHVKKKGSTIKTDLPSSPRFQIVPVSKYGESIVTVDVLYDHHTYHIVLQPDGYPYAPTYRRWSDIPAHLREVYGFTAESVLADLLSGKRVPGPDPSMVDPIDDSLNPVISWYNQQAQKALKVQTSKGSKIKTGLARILLLRITPILSEARRRHYGASAAPDRLLIETLLPDATRLEFFSTSKKPWNRVFMEIEATLHVPVSLLGSSAAPGLYEEHGWKKVRDAKGQIVAHERKIVLPY